ncbi:MAG: bifunctional nuclease family protein [Anaerolineales bacterium]
MSEMVEVVVDSVRASLMSPQRIVVLREIDAERYLPIWVGPYEAEAITIALQEQEVIRPLTHDLLKNVFGVLNARIKRVEIVSLRNDIFYGNIVAEVNGREVNIDSRPSDAIALALRAKVPILVALTVMNMASITPEEGMEQRATPRPSRPSPEPASLPEESEDRLSIFEDFLEKLDKKGEEDDEEKPDEEDPNAPQKR